jgi:anti-sigma B factor antagonist
MKLSQRMHGDVLVLSLEGNLVGEPDASEVRGRIYEILEQGARTIVLDLARLKFINSMGLGVLIASLTSIRRRGGDMILARLNEKVRGVFMITQLVKIVKTYDTVERAVKGSQR